MGVAAEAIEVLNKSCDSMAQISSSLPTCNTSYVYRGKISSLHNRADTCAGHLGLMLTDITAICSRKADGTADGIKGQAEKLQRVSASESSLSFNSVAAQQAAKCWVGYDPSGSKAAYYAFQEGRSDLSTCMTSKHTSRLSAGAQWYCSTAPRTHTRAADSHSSTAPVRAAEAQHATHPASEAAGIHCST